MRLREPWLPPGFAPVASCLRKPVRIWAHTSGQHATDMVDGEVQTVDKTARNITLRHAEIRNVQMPAMTMVFNVRDAALLDKVKAGDKVKFKVEAIGGTPTVTVIEVVK